MFQLTQRLGHPLQKLVNWPRSLAVAGPLSNTGPRNWTSTKLLGSERNQLHMTATADEVHPSALTHCTRECQERRECWNWGLEG